MSTETMIKCLDKLQNVNSNELNLQQDSTLVCVSLTFPKHLYATDIALELICPNDYTSEHLRRNILCPYEFNTNHEYHTNSEKLIKKITAWAEEKGIPLFNLGYIKGSKWIDEDTEQRFHKIDWQAPDEEAAFYISLVWNGKE